MNKKIPISILLILGLLAVGLFIYRLKIASIDGEGKTGRRDTSKIQVIASFYPLYFFAGQIGGDKADITNITPAGAEPHDYEPAARDMAKMEKSRLIILNGGGLETWSDNIKKNIDAKNTTIVVAGEGLASLRVMEDEQTQIDPHVWLSPPLALKMADRIAAGFARADPANNDYYQANVKKLIDKLGELDTAYKQGLSGCAEKNIITSHTAFAYLARDFGLKQTSITGLSPNIEPSVKKLAELARFAKDNQVKYIFFESLVSPKLAKTIANEVGAQTLTLNPIEGLTDQEISQGKDYFSVMRDNLKNLAIALNCGIK